MSGSFDTTVAKYQKRIFGPIVDYKKLSGDRLGEFSESILNRVQAAGDNQ